MSDRLFIRLLRGSVDNCKVVDNGTFVEHCTFVFYEYCTEFDATIHQKVIVAVSILFGRK